MANPVVKVGDILLHISKRTTLLTRELDGLRLTEQELTDKLKGSREKDKKNGIAPFVKEVMETRLKIYYLQGRIQELKDMAEDLTQKVGEAALNGSN